MLASRRSALPVAALVAVTAVWGATFVVTKGALAHFRPLPFLAWRFVVAAGLMLLARPRSLALLGRKGWGRGAILGLVLAGGYVFQTYGLEYTAAAVSGFITGLTVVFVPLVTAVILRRLIGRRVWAATALATLGLGVITLHGLTVGEGALLTLGCAACYGIQLVLLGEWVGEHDSYGLAVVELLTVAVICLVAAAPGGLSVPHRSRVILAVLYTAVAATGVAFVVQSWAQTRISATRVGVIFTLEPVFAAVFAVAAGEHLTARLVLGGLLVLAAMYVIELAPGARPVAPEHGVGTG